MHFRHFLLPSPWSKATSGGKCDKSGCLAQFRRIEARISGHWIDFSRMLWISFLLCLRLSSARQFGQSGWFGSSWNRYLVSSRHDPALRENQHLKFPHVPLLQLARWASITFRASRHGFRSCCSDLVVFSRQNRNSKSTQKPPQPQFRDQIPKTNE